jgi:hypothetical protein
VTTSVPIRIAPPRDADDQQAIKTLFLEYAQSLGFSLDYQDFAAELAGLPGKYAPPGGASGRPSSPVPSRARRAG